MKEKDANEIVRNVQDNQAVISQWNRYFNQHFFGTNGENKITHQVAIINQMKD